MKKLLSLLVLTIGLASSQAAALYAEYKPHEFQVEGLGFADTDDLRGYDWGGGARLTYWANKNIGIGAELKTFNTDHAFFDQIGLNLAGRYPFEKLGIAGLGRIGFDWNAEQVGPRSKLANFEVYVGLGVEKRFSLGEIKDLSIAAELRGIRAVQAAPDEHLQLIVSLGKAF